ncbi:MAG: hypothetical protein HKN00_08490 [Flavobacteriaceae bacterium]|nr:hypothetical protein [Bacteroidia bacterium]MBT8287281.1 hypothetical protein [Bacteroidia bacterium]NNF75205.1 hypothetical protein [Flavobacteriaceae bacterium]NNK74311.1 hypothetical protein [Flavobacteriaceae bacterium]
MPEFIKSISAFLIKALLFALLLFLIHSYLIFQFFNGKLLIPVWAIHCFNIVLVILVYSVMFLQTKKGEKKILYHFFALTILKMILAVLFLTPLFFKESSHLRLEIINFFIPYFLYLGLEINGVYKFLIKI